MGASEDIRARKQNLWYFIQWKDFAWHLARYRLSFSIQTRILSRPLANLSNGIIK